MCGTKIQAEAIAPFELPHDYATDKLEAKVEHERGYALSDVERRLLRLPLFQAVEKNAHWFSMPDSRGPPYPTNLKKLVHSYPAKWDDVTSKVIEAFKAIGFRVGERQFIQSDMENYLYPDLTTSPRREAARNLNASYLVYGLFAFDMNDEIYIGYRQEKSIRQ